MAISTRKKLMITALALQIASGFTGIILSTLILRRILMVIQHILIILFAISGLIGYSKDEKTFILIHGFCTIGLSLALTIYELISKTLMGKLGLEVFFLIPFVFDFFVGIPSLWVSITPSQEQEYSEVPATTYQGYLTQNLLGPTVCCICMVRTAEFAAVPCGHKCLCGGCMERFTKGRSPCPICRKIMNELVKVYE